MMTNPDLPCPHCGRPAVAGARFCVGCGALLAPADAPVLAGGDDREVPWGLTRVTAGLLLFLGLLIGVAFAAGEIGGLYPAQETALQTWAAVHLLALSIGAVVWFLGARRAASPVRALGLARPRVSPGRAAALALAALAISLVANLIYGLVVEGLGLEFLRPPEIDGSTIFSGVGVLLTFQALAVVTPVSEELLFRGFVLRGLLAGIGPAPAIVASALLFSVMHLRPEVMIPIFVTGLTLGWLCVKTGSVWPGIAAHAGQNALALLSSQLV